MSAKKGKDNSKNGYLSSQNDPDLEKKVDQLLSVEEASEESKNTGAPTPETPAAPDGAPASAPLLPTEKLPEVAKKESIPEIKPRAVEPASVAAQPTQPEAADLPDQVGLEEPGTNKAVDEIVASESDELLERQDRRAAKAASVAAPARKNPIKRFFSAWWHNKWARRLTVLAVLAAIAAAAIVPTSRYFLLNAAGVRSSSSVVILDQTTKQPLKNVDFSIGDKIVKTDAEGQASLSDLKLGPTTLKVHKPAFAEINQPVTIGWGSNPLGELQLQPVGTQYKITITDFLSKQPIAKTEATSGQASAVANDKGEIVLTVDQTEEGQIEIDLSATSYRGEKLTLPIGQKDPVAVEMVPARKHAFISKRSGTFDVYKVDVDGKSEEKVLAGTGREKADSIALSVHPSKDVAALVSSRDNNRTANGTFLSSLTMIDLKDNSSFTVTQSERMQLVDWVGDRLVFVKIKEGSNQDSIDRHALVSYDLESRSEKELASTNYFNDVVAANSDIYYAPAAHQVNGSIGLYKVGADGNNKKTLQEREVWSIFRTEYDKLSVSFGQEWSEMTISSGNFSQSGAPAVQKSRVYKSSPDSKTSLWTDERDGKGVLLSYNLDTREDSVLRSQSGLKNPLHWLTGKHIIYRVNNAQETADYIFNTDGGEPQKIRDVTDTAGIDRWYYY
jgi:hypothetical protein